ncbi:TPA: hypothetical protein ACM7IV_004964 [Escherichia coli]
MSSYVRGAAMHCQNPQFWRFLTSKTGKNVSNSSEASVILREFCGISSRKELAKNYAARSMYVQLINEFNLFINGKGADERTYTNEERETLYTSGAHSRGLHSLHY